MKKIVIKLFVIITILLIKENCYATKCYESMIALDLSNNNFAKNATHNGARILNKLGMVNSYGSPESIMTNVESGKVLSYINYLGENFGFFLTSHGTENNIYVNNYPIGTSEINPGYFELVFLNSCKTLKTDKFARAFKTVGYSRRACMGWYDTVTAGATDEFMGHFLDTAGTTNLRKALLDAASRCEKYTPIRIYGDINWNGVV